jgi:hypothetical protein
VATHLEEIMTDTTAIAPDPMLDPTKANLTLSWRVVEESGGRTAIYDIKTVPDCGKCDWVVFATHFVYKDIIPPGYYRMSFSIAEGFRMVVPEAMSAQKCQTIEQVIRPALEFYMSALSTILKMRCPNDVQIEDAVKELLYFISQRVIMSTLNTTEWLTDVPNASQMRSGIIHVTGLTCVSCDIGGMTDLPIPRNIKSITDLRDAAIAFSRQIEAYSSRTFLIGEHGSGTVRFQNGQVHVAVGFTSHTDGPLSQVVNARFAERFGQILRSMELPVISECIVKLRHQFEAVMARVRQVAANFDVPLSDDGGQNAGNSVDIPDSHTSV